MSDVLRIALTADPELAVPPKLYGGIERVVHMLALGLAERGHSVTLFAHPESASAGRLVPWPGQSSRSFIDTASNSATLARHVLSSEFDIVHSFSRIAYLTPILPLAIPKIMTYQRPISARSVAWGHRLSRGTLAFTAISHWMMAHVQSIGAWWMIPNGAPLTTYAFRPVVAPDAPLVFLGRLEEIKGPHLAIEIARRSGRNLIIAGNIPDEKRDWVHARVLNHVDGDHIRYIGPVNDTQKNALLGEAAALVMPILWDEPFGIVMAEAMACGTPILGFARGAVPEVVAHGVTGFVEDELTGLVEGVKKSGGIERMACRQRVETFYSDKAVVGAYEALYRNRVSATRSMS